MTHSEKTREKISASKKDIRTSPSSEFKPGPDPRRAGYSQGDGRKRGCFKMGYDPNRGDHSDNIRNFWLGRTRTTENRRRMSDGIKRFYATHSEERAKLIYRATHQKGVFKDTSIELKVQWELSARGYGYYKHQFILGANADLSFPDKKIAVFCDGNYWHMLPKALVRDGIVNEKLRGAGWLVLRYWGSEINANVEGVVDEIEDILNTGVRASTGAYPGGG